MKETIAAATGAETSAETNRDAAGVSAGPGVGLTPYLHAMAGGGPLSRSEAAGAMRVILEGDAPDIQIGAFLAALRVRGEQADELAGFVDALRDRCVRIELEDPDAVDLCGTGGDGAGTANISTMAAFVAAGAGCTVAKHGNRAVSGRCGSADVLAALGIGIDIAPEKMAACINTVGIGFLFAPLYHPAMMHAVAARRALGIPTCFNILGPMCNPAFVRRQVIGAYSRDAAEKIADVMGRLSPISIFVLTAADGTDEVSLGSGTFIIELRSRSRSPVRSFLSPDMFEGLSTVTPAEIPGGTAGENAAILIDLLEGKKGPYRDVVIANAALALLAAGRKTALGDAVGACAEAIDAGKAMRALKRFRDFTR